MKKILLLLAILLSLLSCEKKKITFPHLPSKSLYKRKKQAKNKLKKWLISGTKPQVMLTSIP